MVSVFNISFKCTSVFAMISLSSFISSQQNDHNEYMRLLSMSMYAIHQKMAQL